MAVQDSLEASAVTQKSIIYDPKIRAIFFQALTLVLLVAFFSWITYNTVENLARLDKKSGFGFLFDTTGFQILTTLGTYMVDFQIGASTYLDVFWIGVINTLAVAVVGIIGATILGFFLGIMRLSRNVVLGGFAMIYVETLRNVPLLLQLFFWYRILIEQLPGKRAASSLFFGLAGLNKTGLYAPVPVQEPGFWITGVMFFVGIAGAILLNKWSAKRQAMTGQRFPVWWGAAGLIIGLPLVVFVLSGSPLHWQVPLFHTDGPMLKRGYEAGVGMVIKPEMIAVTLALMLYTASFIAEIVRAGILAISHGQTEAAHALGLRAGPTLRLVVIPQAMRVIIPPLTSQYLNLIKNSSLAVAIAYPDVVSVFAGTALNQVGQEIEMIFMMMLVYLFFSIVTALFMNWYNSRMKLAER
ncbi:ABC transporter permease subunit [Breoghania sp. L-A4]|uniref:amino acid ABC transporter permease n=1 Tax=Breoghania sp. L-A4 TaxID=2304600 RepID=UPI000E35ADAE|nr:ABC transporter permease subunit [Breoghania sp. L-A4]AXS40923.1 ABC transporter permease subunit [Breoghania sp. L-A4]